MKILYVCSEFYAGMMPFGANIVNTMQNSEHEIFGIFVCSPQCNYRNTVRIIKANNYVFIDTPMDKLRRGYFRIFGFPVINAIKRICKKNKIDIIHLLTEDASLAHFVNQYNHKSKFYYTVHDLVDHEVKFKSHFKKIADYLLVKRRTKYLISKIDNLVTSSKVQYSDLMNIYKNKKIFYHNFPSLVTESIKYGRKNVSELDGIYNYILFFGRIEFYKGIHNLYNQYIKNESLRKFPLVIAGSGEIYFERDISCENNIVFINRYIDDEELNALFQNAYCAIYPYVSATQSGVLSLAYHYQKPVIVSNIPFFEECLLKGETGFMFDVNNPDTLVEAFSKLVNFDRKTSYYYDNTILRNQLVEIYKIY
ncbi:glycosyltransferase [Aquirufa sp. LEPPI-3A]|uniref:glycosyltransferase family 4 protein n=1 Tax=Aquirufa regiilacus TaxID=3024868 RepID=UPI0028DED210|nr:glycosyltransferase [Aquirufa sp. LEPPI-3A]MDT8887881.1 glycosyltransferase [Aquirufa sp. LEPPI-3A]